MYIYIYIYGFLVISPCFLMLFGPATSSPILKALSDGIQRLVVGFLLTWPMDED